MGEERELTADVIVIGSGAGGGFMATALAEAGKSVLLLERGKWFDYTKDFPARYSDWESRPPAFRTGSFFSDPTIDYSKGAPIVEADFDLCSRNDINKLQNYKNRSAFKYHRVFGVGGSTLHYQGEAHRFPDHAFEVKDRYGFGINWPLSYNELAPYYSKAEKWLGVAGAPANPFKPVRGPYPTPVHDLSTKTQWVKAASDRLGWSLLPNSVALPSRPYDGRSPCQHSGMCVQGCPFGAKSSVDLAVLPRGLKTGRLSILDESRAMELETAADGNIKGVVYLQGGVRKRATADRYVLSTGAIETPRILLSNESRSHPNGIGNRHDRVGRNLMETIFSALTVEADRPLQSWKGQPIDSRIWDFNSPDQDKTRSGFVLGVSSSSGSYSGPLSYATRLGSSGRAHKDAMRKKFGRMVSIFGVAEHDPDENNRVTLSEKADELGVPRARVYSDYNALDKATLREMISKIITLAEAANPTRIMDLFSTYNSPQASHLAGTCMMGNDPEKSVVDVAGKVHGMKNLYIADASILPGQGMGDSPSLTIQALALRIAERMV